MTQGDVRQVQLAKGAILSGVTALLREAQVDMEDLDKVMIAGESAFIARLGTDAIRDGINNYRHNQSAPVVFEIIDHDWALWAKAAASRVLIRYIER